MAVDSRRELSHIRKEFVRFHKKVGEALSWFLFDTETSLYDNVYDEGFRQYMPAVRVPILWVDQQEAMEDYGPEGRRPTQRLRFAVSAQSLFECGISVTEAHGNRISDHSPTTVWRADRLNDLLYYDGRFYEVSGFQIRGRLQGEDVIIGISGIETFPSDELNLDSTPVSWFPPTPAPPGEHPEYELDAHITYGPEPPPNPDIGDFWLDTDTT